jgi:hypothetical protein
MAERRSTVAKRVLVPACVRRISDGFSWIDRRFVREGWIDRLTLAETALYMFLVAVADKAGLSFYSDGRITGTLKLGGNELVRARARLLELGLIAWEAPLYQVLEVPASVRAGREQGVQR